MISLISVHGQSEPRIYVNTHHKASAEGLEMTWNGLQGSALHSFTMLYQRSCIWEIDVKTSEIEMIEWGCKRKTSVALWALSSQNYLFGSVWLPERSCNRFSAVFCAVPRRTASTALPRRMATPGGHWPRPATAKTRYQAEAGQDIY